MLIKSNVDKASFIYIRYVLSQIFLLNTSIDFYQNQSDQNAMVTLNVHTPLTYDWKVHFAISINNKGHRR